MAYTSPEGKNAAELEAELRTVFDGYPEYHDPQLGPGGFEVMVEKFANDDFYKLHLVAKAYLAINKPAKGTSPRGV